VEVPWIALLSFVTVIPMYLIVGMVLDAQTLFFHILVNFLVSYCFVSIGRGLHSSTLEVNLSTSGTHDELSWVVRWTEELKLSLIGNECKPLSIGQFVACTCNTIQTAQAGTSAGA
jgi:prepilin signal peptidase PulO-like enzyme (type II secretory pathway)